MRQIALILFLQRFDDTLETIRIQVIVRLFELLFKPHVVLFGLVYDVHIVALLRFEYHVLVGQDQVVFNLVFDIRLHQLLSFDDLYEMPLELLFSALQSDDEAFYEFVAIASLIARYVILLFLGDLDFGTILVADVIVGVQFL